MAAVTKRRTPARGKSSKGSKSDSDSKKVRKPKVWVREVCSIGLLAGALFIFLSLSSHVLRLGSEGRVLADGNWMGPVGHLTATIMVGALGWCGFLPGVWLVWLAFFRAQSDEETPRKYGTFVVALAWIMLLVGLAGISALGLSPTAGGTLGTEIGALLRKFVGLGGASLLCTLFIGLSLALLRQRSLGDVVSFIRTGIRWTSKVLILDVPRWVFDGCVRACRGGVASVGWAAKAAGNALFSSHAEAPAKKKEAQPLPKPRLRKNVIEQSDDAGDGKQSGAPETADEEDVSAAEVANLPRSEPLIVKPKAAQYVARKGDKKKGGSSGVEAADEKEGGPVSSGTPFDDYVPPDVTLLTSEEAPNESENDDELRQKAEQIEMKLRDFNIAGRVTQVHPGPVITLFEFEPAPGVKVGRIAALQDDLAMSLRASSIRIIAPIPKRGTVGIEVPNKHRNVVRLRECLESEAWTAADSTLSVPLGKDTYGDAVVVDIATMPHLLMAGATGTGKSVSINVLLLSLLYRAHPSELGLILIDPKVLELSIYDGIPHLRVPVVTDPRQAKAVLSWAVKEMDRRYRYMQKFGVRNVDGYNSIVAGEAPESGVKPGAQQTELPLSVVELSESDVVENGTVDPSQKAGEGNEPIAAEELRPMSKIVIVIDELADLMLTVGREIEELITRLAQKARAAGIHLIVATQRPSVDVITGLIKANFPARLSFRVSSRIDSRTILDSMGAEKLLGKGDMLYMQPGAVPLKRIHGAFVSDAEVQRVVNSLKGHCSPQYDDAILTAVEKALQEENGSGSGEGGFDEEGMEHDPFYDKAVQLVVEKGQASTSMIQRAFRIGYNRAARIIEVMEKEGIVGPMDGVKPREILVPPMET